MPCWQAASCRILWLRQGWCCGMVMCAGVMASQSLCSDSQRSGMQEHDWQCFQQLFVSQWLCCALQASGLPGWAQCLPCSNSNVHYAMSCCCCCCEAGCCAACVFFNLFFQFVNCQHPMPCPLVWCCRTAVRTARCCLRPQAPTR
jgi:hypothetical protein